jgi:TetR/AcrR family transcriptional regulator, cholesterol catabolism regulator
MNEDMDTILERIQCLYRKYGIKSVTMDDVSRELGISKKTLYQHFTDKNDLVIKIVELEVKKRTESFEEIFSRNLNAIEELIELNRLAHLMIKDYSPVIEYDMKKYYPFAYERIQQVKNSKMYRIILQNMKKGKAEGIFRQDLNEEIIAKLHVSRIMAASDNTLFTPEEIHSIAFFREFFIYHIRGIANEKGLEILEKCLKTYEL